MGKITSEDQLCLTCKRKVIKMINPNEINKWTKYLQILKEIKP